MVAAGCTTSDSPFPSTGNLFVALRFLGLQDKRSSNATLQYVRWEVAGLVGSISEPALDHPFITSTPCLVAASPFGDGDVRRCGGSGITLEAGTTRAVTFRLELARVDGVRAERPDLPDAGDYDGDGVPNGSDNCKIVSNPLVPDGEGGFEQPKSCYLVDLTGAPTVPDQDRDAVSDGADNCLWYPNGDDQSDANLNAIGDVCERTLPAPLPAGGATLECSGVFTLSQGTQSLFVIDFTSALTCDLPGGTCTLALPAPGLPGNPTAITIRRTDQAITDALPCLLVPGL
jgi:hypothetical protein